MNTSTQSQPGLRRAGAVLAGLATVVVLSTAVDLFMHASGIFPAMGQPMPPALWWLAVAYRAAFTLLGGWIAARLSPGQPMRAVWILTGAGCVLGLMGVGVALSKPELGPLWYAWAVALTGPPASWLGGRLYIQNHKNTEAP
jgi:hypothetical protein